MNRPGMGDDLTFWWPGIPMRWQCATNFFESKE